MTGFALWPVSTNILKTGYGKIHYLWPFGSLLHKFQSSSFYDALSSVNIISGHARALWGFQTVVSKKLVSCLLAQERSNQSS